MTDKEIDKIFKEGLQNAVEPTYEGDWENFEKSLPSGKSGFFSRYFLIGLIAFVALSGMTWWYVSNPETKGHVAHTNNANVSGAEAPLKNMDTKTEITAQSSENKPNETTEKSSAKSTDGEEDTNKSLQNQNAAAKAEHKDLKPQDTSKENYTTQEETNSFAQNATKPNSTKTEKEGKIAVTTDDEVIQSAAAPQSEALSAKVKKNENLRPNEIEQPKNLNSVNIAAVDDSQSSSLSKTNSVRTEESQTDLNSYELNSHSTDLEQKRVDLRPLNSLDGILPIPELSDRNVNDKKFEDLPEPKIFETLAFVAIEQNNVLKTSPQIGLMEQVHFSKWTIGLGVGMQRSGRLNWNQKASTVTYGFDKYESGILVNTESIDLLIIPVKLGYHLNGPHRIFAGYTPSVLMNARQNVQVIG